MTPCRKADLAMRESRFADARRLYEIAARKGDFRAWRGLAWMAQKGYGENVNMERALECYQKGAVGDATCAYNLAALLAQGIGGEARKSEVLEWYEKARELGHPTVLARIGLVHKEGMGVPQNAEKAETLFREAIWEGISEARIHLGRWFVDRGEIIPAAQQFVAAHEENLPGVFKELAPILVRLRTLATEGNAEAQYFVGFQHLLAKEFAEGMEWIRVAAEKGNAAAMRELGYAHDSGEGAEEDAELAWELFEKAAHANDAHAQRLIAEDLLKTEGPDDRAEERDWLEKSARQGHGPAMSTLGDLLFERDPEKARDWLRLAALRGHAKSMLALGVLLRDGRGGPVDLVQAARWFIAAIRTGNADAAHEMHAFITRMNTDEIREAARLAGDLEEAESWLTVRQDLLANTSK